MAAHIQRAVDLGTVVGLKEATKEVRQRLDIDLLVKNEPDTFNLFLLALIKLQEDHTGKTGYNELAGIHGLPTKYWDNVKVAAFDRFGGYCAHGLLIFPTWHRPYLALVEQTIYLKMLDQANAFEEPHKKVYLNAAKKFRFPYWDYFRPRDTNATFPGIKLPGMRTELDYDFRMPDVFNAKQVMVRLPPHNALKPVDNPLYTFKWDESHGIPKTQWDNPKLGLSENTFSRRQTVRHSSARDATEHAVTTLNDALNSGREGRTRLMLNLSHDEPYNDFTAVASDLNQKGDITNGPSGSLEASIHGSYHNLIGGNAHMSHPSVASFDPVFWFHHCQIDRLFAVWQAMHPKSWFPAAAASESKAKLYPFRISKDGDKEEFYDSDLSRKTEDFGYIYPDVDGLESIEAIWQRLKDNYTWSIRTPKDPEFRKPPPSMAPLDLSKAQVFQYSSSEASGEGATVSSINAPAPPSTSSARMAAPKFVEHNPAQQPIKADNSVQESGETVDPNFDREWYIDFVVERHAVDGPFTLYFFIGPRADFVDDPQTYVVNPFLAGSGHIFVAPSQACDNCGRQDTAGQLASNTVPITPLLLDYMAKTEVDVDRLQSLRPEHVKPFLEKNLRWRVVASGNEKLDPRRIPGLDLSVSARVSHANAPPTYEIYRDVIPCIIRNASAWEG